MRSFIALFLVVFIFGGCSGKSYYDYTNSPLGQCATQKAKTKTQLYNFAKFPEINNTYPQIRIRNITATTPLPITGVSLVYTKNSDYTTAFTNQYYFKPGLLSAITYINKYANTKEILYLDVNMNSTSMDALKASDTNIMECQNQIVATSEVTYSLYDENNYLVFSKKIKDWGINQFTPYGEHQTWFYQYYIQSASNTIPSFVNDFINNLEQIKNTKAQSAKAKSEEVAYAARELKKLTDPKQIKAIIAKNKIPQSSIPASTALLIIGPESLSVGTIKQLISSKLGEAIIVSKIKRATSGYKDFSLEEMTQLKDWGFGDNVIAAMIDTTTTYETKGIKKEVSNTDLSPTRQSYSAPVEQSNSKSLGDKVIDKAIDRGIEKAGEMLLKRLF